MPEISPGAAPAADDVCLLTGETAARLQAFFRALDAAEIKYAGEQGPRVIVTKDFAQITILLPRPGLGGGPNAADPSTLSLIPVRLCLDNGATVQAQLLGRIV